MNIRYPIYEGVYRILTLQRVRTGLYHARTTRQSLHVGRQGNAWRTVSDNARTLFHREKRYRQTGKQERLRHVPAIVRGVRQSADVRV